MKHFAYCPLNIRHDTALNYAKDHAKDGIVIVVHASCDGKLYHTSTIFNKPRANNYGYDLYLYQLDESYNETYLDCGSFN